MTFDQLGTYTDTATGKPVANVTRYTYIDGDDSYIVTSPATVTSPSTS